MMKRIIPILAIALTFTACKSNKTDLDKGSVTMLQDTTAMYESNITTDKAKTGNTVGAALASSDAEKTAANDRKENTGNSTSATTQSSTGKKGWSHRARGAAVGAGTGAITGAIINKNNRGAGAVIGGLIGAASGYVIGNEVDKKKEKQKNR